MPNFLKNSRYLPDQKRMFYECKINPTYWFSFKKVYFVICHSSVNYISKFTTFLLVDAKIRKAQAYEQ